MASRSRWRSRRSAVWPPRLRRRAAPRSPRFAGATLPSTTASAPRLGLRFGNFGGFLAAALRRTRLASLGAAQLSTLAFVSRVGCRYGGCVCAAPRCAALASRRAHLASFGSVLRSTRLPATALHRARPGGFGASRAAALRRVNCRFGGGAGFTPKRCATRSPRLRCGTNKGPRAAIALCAAHCAIAGGAHVASARSTEHRHHLVVPKRRGGGGSRPGAGLSRTSYTTGSRTATRAVT